MLDLYVEFQAVVAALSEAAIEYALCGGLAMAVYDSPRATVDIDLLVPIGSLGAVKQVAAKLGYIHEAKPMEFCQGAVEIHRVSKIDPDSGDVLMLDLLLVTDALTGVWADRAQVAWEHGHITVVSRDGLILLKSLRGSGQDTDDIERLRRGS